MQKSISLDKNKIVYTLKRSRRARRMRLAVYCDGSVVVTTPYYLNETAAEKFIREKSKWLFSKISFYKQFQGRSIARNTNDDYLKYKDSAHRLVVSRVEYYNKLYKLSINRINIRNQKTRWGSCSMKGNLNFNYKLLFLNERARDYVIVHELCHLIEFNHTKRFWSQVEIAFPNWKEIKKELRNKTI